jgi:hypothetical protein
MEKTDELFHHPRPLARKPYYVRKRRGWFIKTANHKSHIFLGHDENPKKKNGVLVPPSHVLERYAEYKAHWDMLHGVSAHYGLEIPPQLRSVPFVREYRHIGPCIYFLVLENEVIYVGQSRTLPRRIRQHLMGVKGEKKVFDRVYFLPTEGSKLDELEAFYIAELHPRLNIMQPQKSVHDLSTTP